MEINQYDKKLRGAKTSQIPRSGARERHQPAATATTEVYKISLPNHINYA